MTDIKQLIEEEAEMCAREGVENLLSDKSSVTKNPLHSALKMTFILGASFYRSKWQEATRWRKVEEKLPEYRDIDYQVLGLLKNGEYKSIWVIKDSIPQIEVFAYHDVIEWRPIE